MDDLFKQRVMAAILTFNMTVIAIMITLYCMYPHVTGGIVFMRLLKSAGVGIVVAAGAYFGVQMTQK